MENIDLKIGDKLYEIPLITGTEGEKAIDISSLRKNTGVITLDTGFQNTGSCKSAITFIDGEKGVLRYRGYPVEELGQKSTFLEVAYLLIYGELPTKEELLVYKNSIADYSYLHHGMINFFDNIPNTAHPMAILSSAINSFAMYFPSYYVEDNNPETFDIMAARLISSVRTIAAFAYRKSMDKQLVLPNPNLSYAANFLNMMFGEPDRVHKIDKDIEAALTALFIIHADHEQNCSTSTVRLVGSSRVNLYSSVCAGICALWGPLHGGANQQVIEMLEEIYKQGLSVKECVKLAKDKENPFKLMGFGHRVYKTYDPRAKIIKKIFETLMKKKNIKDPLFDIAIELEQVALNDEFFIERNLYPNVDFYSGLIYRAIGIPTNMFTVMFAIGRMPGWIAQWKEMHDTLPFKIGRPRQLYIGNNERKYIEIDKRKSSPLLSVFED